MTTPEPETCWFCEDAKAITYRQDRPACDNCADAIDNAGRGF